MTSLRSHLRNKLLQSIRFDHKYYARKYGLKGMDAPSLEHHYEFVGIPNGFRPHPLFDTAFYLTSSADVAVAGVNPLRHYLEHGRHENRPTLRFMYSEYSPSQLHRRIGVSFVRLILGIDGHQAHGGTKSIRVHSIRVSAGDGVELKNFQRSTIPGLARRDYRLTEVALWSPDGAKEKVRLPDITINERPFLEALDVYVVGGSSLVLSNSGEAYYPGAEGVGLRGAILRDARVGLQLEAGLIHLSVGARIDRGITLCSEDESNFFHFFVDVLTRAHLVSQSEIPMEIPVIATKIRHLHFRDMLAEILGSRPIIYVDRLDTLKVSHLIVPPSCFIYRTRYFGRPDLANDVRIDLDVVREVGVRLQRHTKAGPKKIYLRARNDRLIDQEVAEDIARSHGFEIIDAAAEGWPRVAETLSRAEVVVGSAGAQLTNMLFTAKPVSIAILINDPEVINLSLFSQLATACGSHIDYLAAVGPSSSRPLSGTHAPYLTPRKLLTDWLEAV